MFRIPGDPALSAQLPLELFDLVLEARVLADLTVDLPDRVQHRGVVAIAEAPADLGERPRGEVLCEVHADLARTHHRAMPALREDVLLGHGKVPRDDAQDVLDLDAARLDALHEIADDGLGDVERDRRAHQLPGEIEAAEWGPPPPPPPPLPARRPG